MGSKTSRPAARHSKKPSHSHIWIAALAVLAIVGTSVGVFMHHNQNMAEADAAAINQTLRRDRALGVPAAKAAPLFRKLFQIEHARTLFLPSTGLGSMAGSAAQLNRLKAASATLLANNINDARRLALYWSRQLIRAEGRFSSLTLEQADQEAAHAQLHQLIADIDAWRSQYEQWEHDLHKLAFMAGGLPDGRPENVAKALSSLHARLVSAGPYWQGVAGAKAAENEAYAYLKEDPPQQLTQYPAIMKTLQRAITGLKPPTIAQLLVVLSNLGDGLQNNQARDVLDALSALEAKLGHATRAWLGYDQATAAVNSAHQYLTGSVLSQIQNHASVIAQLESALRSLKAPPPPVKTGAGNPFGAALHQYLATRQSLVSGAVYNANTGAIYLLNPGLHFDTASIVKATIMATLLWQAERAGRPVPAAEQALMIPMIEESSNSAATALWQDAGSAAGIGTFLSKAGMAETFPGQYGYWGLTQTTALDQVTLMKLLSYPNNLLTPASQRYAANLMEHVVSWEAWGVSTGPTPGSLVALKNGWLPIGAQGWEINSIGHVAGDGRNYVVALLSDNNPTESYGIQTLDTVSQFIWNAE